MTRDTRPARPDPPEPVCALCRARRSVIVVADQDTARSLCRECANTRTLTP